MKRRSGLPGKLPPPGLAQRRMFGQEMRRPDDTIKFRGLPRPRAGAAAPITSNKGGARYGYGSFYANGTDSNGGMAPHTGGTRIGYTAGAS